MKKNIWQKQFPTIIGVGVLVIALIGGVFITAGAGPGVFAPRATPQTTPKKIKVTNVTDSSFTVSFYTDEKTNGFIKYGSEKNKINLQTGDDRDQLSGTVGNFNLHHITVRGLKPTSTYYYLIGTGSQSTFDNNGSAFSITTTKKGGTPSAAKTAYGVILNEAGSPAQGAIVYANIQGVGLLSSLVKESGSWAIALSTATAVDGSGYATISDNMNINLTVQGPASNQIGNFSTTVAESQPVKNITLTATGASMADSDIIDEVDKLDQNPTTNELNDTLVTVDNNSPNTYTNPSGAGLNDVIATEIASGSDQTSSSSAYTNDDKTIVNVDLEIEQTVETTRPTIIGTAPSGATISIEVNSETQITGQIIVDEQGNYTFDVPQDLEPGIHSVTITYLDATGQEITTTKEFVVAQNAETTISAPYGTGNPYSLDSSSSTRSTTSTQASSSSPSTRVAMPSSSSSIPVSGSITNTLVLIFGGIFFIISGLWSFWVAEFINTKQTDC